MSTLLRTSLAFSLLLLVLSACDSGDSVDEPHPRDVAGVYAFTEFSFQPSGQGFQPIAVLDTLVQSETNLRLSSGGNFILSFQFVNGELYFPAGDFSVSEQSVRLNGNNEDRADFERLLLDDETTLRHSVDQPGVLTAEVSKTINPSEFSERYQGVTEMSGTLTLRLVRQ
jgi:hypothetical protein